jgi:hypothetical protein
MLVLRERFREFQSLTLIVMQNFLHCNNCTFSKYMGDVLYSYMGKGGMCLGGKMVNIGS